MKAFVIPTATVAEARADVVGVGFRMFGDGGCTAMADNKGGAGGVCVITERDVGGGFAFAEEFRMSRIDDVAFF